jgi:hypothetical protein
VFLWFAGVSFAFVWMVFRSPALDYRLVMAGSVFPIVDVVLGGPRQLHTLLFSVLLLGAVMVLTRDKRLVRRRWISLPIGVMMHLVLDGIWTEPTVFWWPSFGLDFGPAAIPELDRGAAVAIVMELIGLAALAWCWFTFDLKDPEHRRAFVQTGHLPRELASS